MATILVVDDHPVNRDLLVTLLGYSGHTVLESGDGAEALLIAREQHPDVVITDLIMPVMDGYELVRELRGDSSPTATRVIFYTANYLRDEVEPVAAALGVRHVVSKPADPPALLAVAEEVLNEVRVELIPAVPEAAHKGYLRALSGKLADKVRELEAAQASLIGSEERFRSLAESSPVGIFSLDGSGRVTYLNPPAEGDHFCAHLTGQGPGAGFPSWPVVAQSARQSRPGPFLMIVHRSGSGGPPWRGGRR